jgi:hypothetical protein
VQWTSLHCAARDGRLEACQLLIDAKADLDAKTMCAFMFECCIGLLIMFCCIVFLKFVSDFMV